MSDLSEFLLVRIAEEEAAAREATVLDGAYPDEFEITYNWCREVSNSADGSSSMTNVIGIWSPSPERVLAECEAKRRIVEPWTAEPGDGEDDWLFGIHAAGHGRVLRLLALPYADHPDYREEWRP